MILQGFLEPRQTINTDYDIMARANLKATTSRVKSAKIAFLLQQGNTRTNVSLNSVEHIANLDRIVLPHLLYSLDLVFSD